MSYVNNQLIECLRQSSTENGAGNDENLSQFTNKLNQAVKLEVGDTISIERAFINGLGAGNQNTIQLSGRRMTPKKPKTQTYTVVQGSNYQDNTLVDPIRLDYYLSYNVSEVETDPLEIKDNEASVIIGYYLNSCNHPSYIQLPRRFAASQDLGNTYDYWNTDDSAAQGLPLVNQSVDTLSYCYHDWKYFRSGTVDELKQKVDNSRYTLYLREFVYYSADTTDTRTTPPTVTAIAGAKLSTTDPYLVSGAKYYRYKERKIIKVDKGFNTPQSIADQIKLQLNQSKPQETFEVRDPTDTLQKHAITTVIKAETYKPFNVANIHEFSDLFWTDFVQFEGNPLQNSMVQYDSQYFAVGVKRPEIWDAGRMMDDPKFSILFSIKIADKQTSGIYIDLEWTLENLTYLKNLFEAQKLYPELWADLDKLPDYADRVPDVFKLELIPSKSCFLHMSRYGSDTTQPDKIPHPVEHFGQDGIGSTATPYNSATAPQFFTYDENQKDFFISSEFFPKHIGSEWDSTKYVFGFAQPFYDDPSDKFVIRLDTTFVGGISDGFFTGTDGVTVNSKIWGTNDLSPVGQPKTIPGRYIGYDKSWTAYGTACILPYSSHAGKSFEGQLNAQSAGNFHWADGFKERRTVNSESSLPYLTQAYLGANNPICDFNSETNRFEFSQLHIAENVGNTYNAGDMGSESIIPPPINADAGDVVYKINPRIGYDGFAPTFKPYNVDAQIQFADPDGPNSLPDMSIWENPPDINQQDQGAALNSRDISLPNEHIEPYKIFDAWGGIYLDDMGYNIEEWEQSSLWGRMGFTWDQFNSQPTKDNILDNRVSEETKYNLYRATTNAIVDTTDTKAFVVNLYGAPLYSTMLGGVKTVYSKIWQIPGAGAIYPHCTFVTGPRYSYYPALTQKTSSFVLPARNLPKIQLNPFYTIRSDIIGYTEYLGSAKGGMRLPVVGIVDRYGAQGDFFYGSPSDLSFTVTKQTIISDIQTAICNPDGSFADIDSECGVIYKIQKSMAAPQNIFQQIIDNEKTVRGKS